MPVQGLHLFSQNVVAGLLAEEHEKSADGTVDQLPLLVLVLAELAGDGLCRSGYLKLLDSAFHHLRCGFAVRTPFPRRALRPSGPALGSGQPAGGVDFRARVSAQSNLR
jgi:hypothetical protein